MRVHPHRLVRFLQPNPRIRVLPLRGFSNEAEIGLYWKKDEPLSPAAQLFLQFLREEEKKTENSL